MVAQHAYIHISCYLSLTFYCPPFLSFPPSSSLSFLPYLPSLFSQNIGLPDQAAAIQRVIDACGPPPTVRNLANFTVLLKRLWTGTIIFHGLA